ncbi:MAG: NAD(P)/FAD-dependent oxidoreductase [Fimbriimonas sp.]|nr:NAD(P)/FAD-dependent oxidoreductase [Fimbriimonas sp.]
MRFDVAIIGGGPGGSTCGAFLRKYKPKLKVGIFERETFPRDHVGESQLPAIGKVLNELGIWDRIEAADFPIKVGGTYKWGRSDDLWDFHFLPNGEFHDEPRPGKYRGQRLETAFQVDRAVYDKILLDYARELGCDVFEGTGVREVVHEGDTVSKLILDNGDDVEARHFVDASGHIGLLRRSIGVKVDEPSTLKNVAFWDYWQNAEWAVELGIGGTRIQVMSVGYGWLWFIPLSPSRTSIGFVCPADYYKKSGLKPQDLYRKAVQDEPRIRDLVQNATCEDKFATTKDWSFLAERLTGANWILVGESAGFADPILSAGLSLTHASAREAAFSILEVDRGGDKQWIDEQYGGRNARRVLQHIRFADYWYAGNRHFSDLKEYTREIARDAGLDLDAENAFRWLGTGGFIEEDLGIGGFGTLSFSALQQVANRLSDAPSKHAYSGYNGFVLNFEGARRIKVPHYESGRVLPIPAWTRDGKILPLSGLIGYLVKGLEANPQVTKAFAAMANELRQVGITYDHAIHGGALQCLEALIRDGWVECRRYKSSELLLDDLPEETTFFQKNRDETLPKRRSRQNLDPAP